MDADNKAPERLVRWIIAAAFLAASSALWWPAPVHAAVRIKEVAAVQGVRSNPLDRKSVV